MSKRKSSSDGHHTTKRPKPHAKKHLYLLLEDWERGYSIHKLDIDTFTDHDAKSTDDQPPSHFTEPLVARIEAQHSTSCNNLISHGTKIFAMQPGESKPAIPAFDTHALTICPWPSCHGDYYCNPLLVSVSGKLFLFTDVAAEVLGDQPPPYDSKAAWSWTTIKQAARPPFHTRKVLCYALHPDGRTLFVSAGERRRRSREEYSEEQGQGTFSFDAERLEWTWHGKWVLPFSGEAYFDAELEAWVGLCGERNCVGWLCSCDVVDPVAGKEFTASAAPVWNLGQEKLFGMGPQVHRFGAKLLYMGDSNFCLVESQLHKADEQLFHDSLLPWPPRRRVLCITTIGLKYNKKGELQTKLRRAGVCKTYKRPHDFGESLADLAPSAFWL